MDQVKKMNMSFVTSQNMFVWLGTIGQLMFIWLLANYMNLLMVTLVFGFLAIVVVLYKQVSTVCFLDEMHFFILYINQIVYSMKYPNFLPLHLQAQEYARLSQEISSRRQGSQGSSGSGSSSSVTALAEELNDGTISVGKILFNPQKLLGKGCDGTFVFRLVLRDHSLIGL